jgi:hypothetical protein
MVYLLQAEAATHLGNHAWLVEANQRVPHWTPNDFVSNMEMLVQLGFSAYYEGDLNQTKAYWQQAFDLHEQHSGQYLIWLGANQRDCADMLRDCNRLEEALALASSAIPLLEKWHTAGAAGYGKHDAQVLVAGDRSRILHGV